MLWALAAIVVGFAFQSSGLGLRLRGSREDDIAARSLGIGVRTERRVAWVLHGFVMGVGGALYGQYLGSFNASFFYLALTFTTLAMLVVGGITSLSGAVIGSLTISFVAEVLHRIEQGADVGALHIPARPGLREVGLAIDHAGDSDPASTRVDERPRAAMAESRGPARLRAEQPVPSDLPPADTGSAAP